MARVGARAPRSLLHSRRLTARLRGRAVEERGFTIVEVIVAALVLTVGLLAAFFALVISDHASADVRAREGAVTLARQITEDARQIPYSQIAGSTIVSQLQAMPGLASTSSGSTWTISRSRFTYTVRASVTTVNDPKDTTTDLKQVTATVNWTTFQGKTHTVSETTTLTRAGQDPGLTASSLCLVTSGAGISGPTTPCNNAPIISSTGISSLQFSVTAPAGTTTIVWTLNGGKQTAWNGAVPASGTTWTSAPWSLSGVSDGSYTIGAQAEDAFGVDGPAITIPVRLIRNVPSAPVVTDYGFNPRLTVNGGNPVAELQWKANPELNVVGYRIYGPQSSTNSICQTTTTTAYGSCGTTAWCLSPTACIDLNPPAPTSSNLTYTVRALYYDANNTLREGTAQQVTLAAGTPVPPPPPTNVTVTAQPDGSATVTWTPPSTGTAVSFYRIYRGGNNYPNRYDTSKCSATSCSYHDASAGQPLSSYFVSAVGGTTPGSNLAESTAIQAAGS